MANIRIDLNHAPLDGETVSFKAPCNASDVSGLIIYYLNESEQEVSKEFTLNDANGNDIGVLDNVFAEGAIVKVILDTDLNNAFMQNPDTNAYLEGRFEDIYNKGEVDSGFVKKTGDTMTGSLIVECTSSPFIGVKDTTQGRYGRFTYNVNEEVIISNTKDLQNRVLLFLCNENHTDDLIKLASVSNGVWTDYNILHTGNHGMKLLWENAKPTSEFPAQQIFVDFKGYDLAIVRFSRDGGGGYQTAVCVKNKEIDASTAGYISVSGVSKKGVAARRYVKMTDDYMNFGGGHFDTSSTDSTQNNFAMVPVEIYGIKGGF